ncbi:cyclase family protein [Hymenobacter busanensis]|uniref:Cyclase family protein n=1 Tax=Hymenobacter busanensis TaxID=2607656 RepID=A0A7L4ZZN2_9BACT|nr:cyclase family protein [Hymenobacter busanensis]KAA9333020.1 cyclase family protein [Hymenobacter busanensis]QHJ08306.1 cyclase family protein [Hymenobacter busanensis]
MLTTTLTYHGQTYRFNPAAPLDIALPLAPGPDQVNCFWAEPVEIDVIRVGDFVGSVAEGGSTNYKRVHLTPHGNGTHTECYGHISPDPAATLPRCLTRFLFVAQLISVAPRPRPNGDYVVELADVQPFIEAAAAPPEALVLRTLPNETAKRTRQYSGTNPPYITAELADYLVAQGIEHLLLDLPSVDRELDNGVLAAHHAFWQYPAPLRPHATITELIFVPDSIADGLYLLNLQVTMLELDASPSRPVLYALEPAADDTWAGH